MAVRDGVYEGCKYGRLSIPYAKLVCSRDDTTRVWEDVCMNHYRLIQSFPKESRQSKMEGRGQ